MGCCGECWKERAIAPQAEETPLHPNVRKDRDGFRDGDAENGRYRETSRETEGESYAHMQRWSETERTRDIEGKTEHRDKWIGLYLPHPTQHRGQLEAAHLPEEPLLSFAPSVSAVGLIVLAEVFTTALSTISEHFKLLQ